MIAPRVLVLRARLAALPVATVLAGCVPPPPASYPLPITYTPSDTSPHKLTPEQVELIQKGVRKRLKDPDSARFGAVGAAQSNSAPGVFVVCGYVNSKNSYGGYGGMSPFIGGIAPVGGEPGFVMTDLASNAGEARIAEDICRQRHGINLVELADR